MFSIIELLDKSVFRLFDGFSGETRTISLRPRKKDWPVCGDSPTIAKLENYAKFCGSEPTDKMPSLSILSNEMRILPSAYDSIRRKSTPILIDTRPENEFEIAHLPEAINIPYDTILKRKNILEVRKRVETPFENDQSGTIICYITM